MNPGTTEHSGFGGAAQLTDGSNLTLAVGCAGLDFTRLFIVL